MGMIGRLAVLSGAIGLFGILLAQHEVPIKVPPGVQEQKLIHRTKVVYPQRALGAHISGIVKLSVLIDENGVVHRVHLVSGHPLLVRAATAAVRKWRYQPTYIGDHPVQVLTIIEVPFVLPDAGIIEPASTRI
jgi:TonB family protein